MATQNKPSLRGTNQPHDATVNNKQIALAKKPRKDAPKLRFKEFEGEWKKNKLNHLIKDLKSGISVNSEDRPIENNLEFGILKTSSVVNGIFIERENKKIIDNEVSRAKLNPTKNEIIISRMNTPQLVGESGYIDKTYHNLFIPDRLWQTVTCKEKCHNKWLSIFLITDRIRYNLKSIATGTSGTMKNISKPNFLSIKVNYPSLPEQQKIASFLSEVDTKLQQLSTKKEKLSQYKKGVMQQLFSQQLRFKADDGSVFPDWKEVKGNVLFKSVSDKKHNSDLPILAITQDQGAIPRDLINYKMIVTEKSVASYKVVQVGDFIISLRSFQGGIEYSNYKGICSPAYNILRPVSKEVNKDFYKRYLKTGKYIRQLQSKLEGIRDGKMISFKYFSEIELPFPCFEEQQKIVNYLDAIEIKIAVVQTQISNTQAFKKGLLQQLFV
jgi:type I restriction enzyme S subunit